MKHARSPSCLAWDQREQFGLSCVGSHVAGRIAQTCHATENISSTALSDIESIEERTKDCPIIDGLETASSRGSEHEENAQEWRA